MLSNRPSNNLAQRVDKGPMLLPPFSASLTFPVDMARALSATRDYAAQERSYFQGICGEAYEGRIAPETVADAWHRLHIRRFGDFLSARERIGLLDNRVSDDLSPLLSPLGARPGANAGLISDLGRLLTTEPHPELALCVHEFSILGDAVRDPANRLLYILSNLLLRIEEALGGSIPLVDVRIEEWEGNMGLQPLVRRLRGRILSPRLFQRAIEHLYSGRDFRFDYRFAAYDGPDLRALRRQNVLGTSLNWEPAFLKDIEAHVPGWFFRLHDDYHKADQVLMSPETKTVLDRFSDFVAWVRATFTGTAEEVWLLETLQDHLDDREAAYRYRPREAMERLWSIVPLYYLALPVLEPHWMKIQDRHGHILPALLKDHYHKEIPLRRILSEFFPRSSPGDRAAYRRAVDFLLKKARRFPGDGDTRASMTRFFEDLSREQSLGHLP